MLGNAVIPLFVKLSEVALGMFEYLQQHQREVQAVFKALSFVIGAVLTPILIKATIAALAFIAPFIPFIATVGALGAAFGLLYDDYKTWAEGGKSLFDWGAFSKYIDNATLSTDNLKNAFKNLYKDMINNTIPTLRGYAEIIQKLVSGDFKGAGLQAWGMIKQLGSNVAGVVDDLTGQEKGTLEQAAKNLINPPLAPENVATQKYSSKAFTPEKAAAISRVAKNIGVNPNDLAAVISFETGGTFDPNARNKGSSATG
ncbi:putative lysozyme-like domain protein [Acinetobacter phage phiAC-1]|uniref:putative lysozyme-like domain protein n=1 Tax=Acinetobacter phage phiAC-1 TaxID=1229760 RepID=UPI00028AD9A9|nr:putative lysozyme-like domain protein [Acinetobacter phage phiAC-1]AFU62307.1 putative lysozyme-like domain protein [Acinetobacter phage phiAC-1]